MKLITKDISAPRLTKLILGIIVVASAFYLVMSAYQSYSYRVSLKWKQKNLKLFKKEGLGSLENKKTALEKQLSEFTSYYKQIEGVLSSKPNKSSMPKEGDPLKFKEELYKVQSKLQQEGSSIGFEFPAGLGFGRYEKEIPTPSELPLRIKQLDIIQEIGILMLKAKVPKITAVEFKDVKDVTIEKSDEVIFKKFPLKISFNCKNENLIDFLHELTISDIPFMIDSVNLKASDETAETKGELAVELVIVAAIFP